MPERAVLASPLQDPAPPPGDLRMAAADFARLAAFIEQRFGIRMPPAKRTLLEARLARRVRALGLPGFGAYCDRVLGGSAPDEQVQMVDLVTTNKTDFFREPQHFEHLTAIALPDLAARLGTTVPRELRVWSAGCSTGEEPYSLAMVLAEHAEATPGFRFRILATDLSTRVLRHAAEATYSEPQVAPVPLPLRRKYLLRSVAEPERVRVKRRLREAVSFRKLNLMAPPYPLGPGMDVIFCRNVFIYFHPRTQAEILERFAEALGPGGYLFLGHSETVMGRHGPFELVAPTVYRVRQGA